MIFPRIFFPSKFPISPRKVPRSKIEATLRMYWFHQFARDLEDKLEQSSDDEKT